MNIPPYKICECDKKYSSDVEECPHCGEANDNSQDILKHNSLKNMSGMFATVMMATFFVPMLILPRIYEVGDKTVVSIIIAVILFGLLSVIYLIKALILSSHIRHNMNKPHTYGFIKLINILIVASIAACIPLIIFSFWKFQHGILAWKTIIDSHQLIYIIPIIVGLIILLNIRSWLCRIGN
jgi:hypothetical protein